MGAGMLDWMKREEVYRRFKVTFRLELLVKCRTGLGRDGFQSRASSLSRYSALGRDRRVGGG